MYHVSKDRLAAIEECWQPTHSAATLAAAVSEKLGTPIGRGVVIGLYDRNPRLKLSHPLGGRRFIAGEQGRPRSVSGVKLHHKRLEARGVVEILPPRTTTPKLRVAEEARSYDAGSRHIPLWQVGHDQCHWPVNDPQPGMEHLFCGHEAEEGKRYCAHHQHRSTKRGS